MKFHSVADLAVLYPSALCPLCHRLVVACSLSICGGWWLRRARETDCEARTACCGLDETTGEVYEETEEAQQCESPSLSFSVSVSLRHCVWAHTVQITLHTGTRAVLSARVPPTPIAAGPYIPRQNNYRIPLLIRSNI